VSSSQAKPSLTTNAANAANVGGKAMNSFKKAVAIKADSEEAKPLMSASNGRYGNNYSTSFHFNALALYFNLY
jgi:hypothetical protein